MIKVTGLEWKQITDAVYLANRAGECESPVPKAKSSSAFPLHDGYMVDCDECDSCISRKASHEALKTIHAIREREKR